MCPGERRTRCTCLPRAPRTHSYRRRPSSAWPALGRSHRAAGRSNPRDPFHPRTDRGCRCHPDLPTPCRGPHRSPEPEVAAARAAAAAVAAVPEAAPEAEVAVAEVPVAAPGAEEEAAAAAAVAAAAGPGAAAAAGA